MCAGVLVFVLLIQACLEAVGIWSNGGFSSHAWDRQIVHCALWRPVWRKVVASSRVEVLNQVVVCAVRPKPGINELIVVTLLVAYEGPLKLPNISSREDFRTALNRLGALRSDAVCIGNVAKYFWQSAAVPCRVQVCIAPAGMSSVCCADCTPGGVRWWQLTVCQVLVNPLHVSNECIF